MMQKAKAFFRGVHHGLSRVLSPIGDILSARRGKERSDPRTSWQPALRPVEEPGWLGALRRRLPWMSNQLLIAILPLLVGGSILLLWSAGGRMAYERLLDALPTVGGEKALARATSTETDALVGTDIVLAVRLSGRRGIPLEDSVVSWEVVTGDGIFADDSVRTNDRGEALNTLRLPDVPGHVTVAATVREANPPRVVFSIDVDSAGTSRLRGVRGNEQAGLSGFPLPDPLSVEVTDRNGDAVPSVAVRFEVRSGGGAVDQRVVLTDAFGRASARWRLGPVVGRQEMTVRIPAAGDTTFTFVARAEEGPEPAQDGSSTIVAGELTTVADAPASVIPIPGPVGTPGDPEEQEAAAPESTDPQGAEPDVNESDAAPEIPGDSVPADGEVEGSAVSEEPLAIVRRNHAVGGEHVCILSGGTAHCRGANDRGQSRGTGAGPLLSLVAGLSHTCGLDDAGAAVCWGGNESGQLGDGSGSDGARARPVLGELRFAMLAAGVYHTCGLDRSGRIHCWGGNPDGQLGDGTRDNHSEPSLVESSAVFRGVVAGWNHTCGLEVTGGVLCWGSNDDGQLGDGSRRERPSPVRVPGTFSALAAGSAHTCGIRGGRVLCWGDNSFGQLGDGTTTDRSRPVAVTNLGDGVVEIAAGAVHTCALLESGALYCWGQNLRGELGDGTNQDRVRPTLVAGGLTFRSVEAGGAVTCAFSTDGSEYCWGQNRSGQLGDGSRTGRAVPTRVLSR